MSNEYSPIRRFRLLTGERLEIAKRIWWQDVAVGIGTAVFALLYQRTHPQSGMDLYILVAVLIGWLIYRFVRKETFFQLRLRELEASKQQSAEALKELQDYAEGLKEHGKNSSQTS